MRYDTEQFLATFLDPAHQRVQSVALAPRARDFDRVFWPEAAERARRVYGVVHAAYPRIAPRPEQARIAAVVAEASELVEHVSGFPTEYRTIARHFRPGVLWACGVFADATGANVTAIDGLVALGERWVWLPRPWLALIGLRAPAVAHWVD